MSDEDPPLEVIEVCGSLRVDRDPNASKEKGRQVGGLRHIVVTMSARLVPRPLE